MRIQESELKGSFYLGGRVGDDGTASMDAPFLYRPRDLTTHAVCLGMTGSGKTGLGIALLEEAALNRIPALIIDPKGDMTNLLLTFPELSAADFRPWVDLEGARRQGLSLDQYAEQVASSWKEGLGSWGIDGERIARLRASARFDVYTPGSDAGMPVNIVQSLHVPDLDWDRDAEILRETISGTVSALLALIDVDSPPVSGREHNLLATIIEHAWQAGEDMDLAKLIVQIQKCPFDRMGVLPLEVFYPQKERMELALALNGLLAAPRFAAWLEGDSLDIDALLHTPDGTPKMSIFYLAHLSDSERMFFVTLLLERMRAWIRTQEGTPSLRAILYMDELYGFMPPHPANPPTKAPLLALLKQARAQGLGLVLCTQNPIDLDYKGLSNIGTWFVGKLQTANDRRRILEGLDSASIEAGVALERAALDDMIGGLNSREFLSNNIRASGPVKFKTRHVMSYLRGPLTRDQIRELVGQAPVTAGVEPRATASESAAPAPVQAQAASTPEAASPWEDLLDTLPVLPTGIHEYYMPARISLEWAIHSAEERGRRILYQDKQLVYRPALIARASVRIDNATHNVHEQLTVSRVLPAPEESTLIAWNAEPIPVQTNELDSRPAQDARFAPLPTSLADARRLKGTERDFTDYVYRETALELARHRALKLTAQPDESESQFKRRCYKESEERRDAELRKLEERFETQIDRLETRIRREERELEQDRAEHGARKREELISAGESLLNLLSKRRSSRALSTASRRRRMTQQSKADIEESVETIEDLQQQIQDLQEDLEHEKSEISARWAELADDLETIQIRPRKSDIFVDAWGIIWMPYWDVIFEDRGEERRLSLPAFESESS